MFEQNRKSSKQKIRMNVEVVELDLCLHEGERNTVPSGGSMQMIVYNCNSDGTGKSQRLRQGWVGVIDV